MSFERLVGGTEAAFRGRRRVTSLGGRSLTNADDGYRRLDPLPERLQGRRIVVSPTVDDDKGKSADMHIRNNFLVFFYARSCNVSLLKVIFSINFIGFLKHFPVFSLFTTAALFKAQSS